MIKWQSQAIRALLSESDKKKAWGYEVDVENDCMKNIWGSAANLSIDAINAKAMELKNASEYIDQRTNPISGSGYPPIGEQLDKLYKDIVAGTLTTSGEFAKAIKTVKDKYPKP